MSGKARDLKPKLRPWGGGTIIADNGGSMDKLVMGEGTKRDEPGMRKDSGKLRWHLIPIPALLAFCKVWHGGSIKYDEEQWRGGMKYTRIYRPMMSHLNKWLTCKSSYDPELGTHHLMMVAWGCFVLYMYEVFLGHEKFDDRPDKGTLTEEDFEYEPMPFITGTGLGPAGQPTGVVTAVPTEEKVTINRKQIDQDMLKWEDDHEW